MNFFILGKLGFQEVIWGSLCGFFLSGVVVDMVIVSNQWTQKLKLIGKCPIIVFKHSNTPPHVQDQQACHMAWA